VSAGPADGAAGADAGDEVGDRAVGLRPDLRAGGVVVRQRVVDVGVLVGLPAAGPLGRQPVGDVVVGLRMFRRNRGRTYDDLGAVRLQHVDLVERDLVGADEHAAIAALLRDDREADARVAAGRFDDRAAGLELARRLRRVDHPLGDAVLHGTAGV